MALGSTQPPTEMSTVNISWEVPIVLKPRTLNLLEPSVPVQVCNAIALPLHFTPGTALHSDKVQTLRRLFYKFRISNT
jgi:hypothetical protein